jgi:hypothetical protein
MLLYVDSQFASPYAMSAFVSLHEKGVSFDVETVDLSARENREPSFASTSITQRVPTLVHDDFTLSESSAISEYIEESFPGSPLYPADLRQRARARQVQAWLRSDLMPIRNERQTPVVFYGSKMPPLSAEARAAADRLFSRSRLIASQRLREPIWKVVHRRCRSCPDVESSGLTRRPGTTTAHCICEQAMAAADSATLGHQEAAVTADGPYLSLLAATSN